MTRQIQTIERTSKKNKTGYLLSHLTIIGGAVTLIVNYFLDKPEPKAYTLSLIHI